MCWQAQTWSLSPCEWPLRAPCSCWLVRIEEVLLVSPQTFTFWTLWPMKSAGRASVKLRQQSAGSVQPCCSGPHSPPLYHGRIFILTFDSIYQILESLFNDLFQNLPFISSVSHFLSLFLFKINYCYKNKSSRRENIQCLETEKLSICFLWGTGVF